MTCLRVSFRSYHSHRWGTLEGVSSVPFEAKFKLSTSSQGLWIFSRVRC